MVTRPEPIRAVEQTPKGAAEAVRAAVEYGVDLSMLKANLALTVAERLRRHQIALNTAEMLWKAKEAMNRPRDREAIRQLRAIKELEEQGG